MGDEHLAQDKEAWGGDLRQDRMRPQQQPHRCMWRGCPAQLPFAGYCPQHQEMRKQGQMPEPLPGEAKPVQAAPAKQSQRKEFDASAMMFQEAARTERILGGGGAPDPEPAQVAPPAPTPAAVASQPAPAASFDLVTSTFALMDVMQRVPEEHRPAVFEMLEVIQGIPEGQRQQVLELVTNRLNK